MTGPATKRCPTCDRPVFSMYQGDLTIVPPARVERIEASGNVTATCRCGRRVTWFRNKKATGGRHNGLSGVYWSQLKT